MERKGEFIHMDTSTANKNAKLCIIVPIYNQELWLHRCVDSLLALEIKDYEILLVNDGSTDGSHDICLSYLEDKRVKLLEQENQGLTVTRNNGVSVARNHGAEYITFVDSDDWVEPWMYNDMLAQLEGNEDVEVAVCGFKNDYEGSIVSETPLLPEDKILSSDEALALMMQGNYFKHFACGKIYRSTLFEHWKFPVEASVGEDLIFNVGLFKFLTGRIGYSRGNGYHYCFRSDSMSNKNQTGASFLNNIFYETMRVHDFMSECDIPSQKLSLAKKVYQLAYRRLERLWLVDDESKREQLDTYQEWLREVIDLYGTKSLSGREANDKLEAMMRPYETACGYYHRRVSRIASFLFGLCGQYKNVYLYDTGEIGTQFGIILQAKSIRCRAYIVKSLQGRIPFFQGLPLLAAEDVPVSADNVFVITTPGKRGETAVSELISMGHEHIFYFDGSIAVRQGAKAGHFAVAAGPQPGAEICKQILDVYAGRGMERASFPLHLVDRKHIFWGTGGAMAIQLRRELRHLMRAGDFYIDEASNRQGGMQDGLPICPPAALETLRERCFIIVLSEDYPHVRDRLLSMGYVEEQDFLAGDKLVAGVR